MDIYITFNVIFGIVSVDLTKQIPRQKQHHKTEINELVMIILYRGKVAYSFERFLLLL